MRGIEFSADVIGEDKCAVRTNLYAKMATITASATAGEVDMIVRGNCVLKRGQPAIHANRMLLHVGVVFEPARSSFPACQVEDILKLDWRTTDHGFSTNGLQDYK